MLQTSYQLGYSIFYFIQYSAQNFTNQHEQSTLNCIKENNSAKCLSLHSMIISMLDITGIGTINAHHSPLLKEEDSSETQSRMWTCHLSDEPARINKTWWVRSDEL